MLVTRVTRLARTLPQSLSLVTMLHFSDEAPELCPPDASPGFPRIIASPESPIEGTDASNVHLADVVATHLYNWNPDALHKFLDLRRGKFEYALERPSQLTFLVARLGQKIQVRTVPAQRLSDM